MTGAPGDVIDKLINKPKDTVELLYEPIENGLKSIGLMTGTAAPARRLMFGFGIGSALTYMAKPTSMYDQQGNPRPWSLLDPEAENASPVQWWMPGAAAGVFLGLFV